MLTNQTKRSLMSVLLTLTMAVPSVCGPVAFAAEDGAGISAPISAPVNTPTTPTDATTSAAPTTPTTTPTENPEEATRSYTIHVTGDRGLDLAKSKFTVEEGGEVSVEADPAIGFNITKVRLNDGTHMETAYVRSGQLLLDGKVYRIDEANGRVALRLTDVQSDMQIHFFAEADPNYKSETDPFTVSVSGEQGVKIDQAVTNTTRGKDVDAVAYASPGYQITKVRLEDGVHTQTAWVSGKRIVLNGKAYAIENDNGYIKVRLTDVQSDMKVYFYADPIKDWGPGYPGWRPSFPDDWRPGQDGWWIPTNPSPSDPDATSLDIDIAGSLGVELDHQTLSVSRGHDINIVADAKRNYIITKVRVSDGVHTETAAISSGCIWLGSKKYIIDESGGQVTLRLTNVQDNLSVYFFTNADNTTEVPYGYHGIELQGDDKVLIDDALVTVRKGNSTNVSATAKSGYEIVKVRVEYGNYQKTAYVSDGRIEINGKTYRIDKDGREVTVRLTDVRNDATVRFYTDLNAGDYPYAVEVEGDDGVVIEEDLLHADEGDALNVTAEAEEGYEIKEITLDDGKRSETASVSDGRLWLNGKMYNISKSHGRVTLRLTDVNRDMTVHFKTNVDKNKIPIKISETSQNCSINASNSFVKKGGSIVYTVVPAYGYRLNTVTLRVGSSEATASVNAGVIKVGNKSYKMAMALNGTLTISVDDIKDAVELSVDTVNILPDYSSVQYPVLYPGQTQYPNQYPTQVQIQGPYKLYLRSDIRAPYIQGFGDGRFGPKNTLTRAEAAVMLSRLTNYDAQISYPVCAASDVQQASWYSNAVNAFYATGIETGSSFRPNAPITRGELAIWLYRLSGCPAVNVNTVAFPDTYGYTELNSAVAFGKMQGWINGYPDGTYRPNSSLIRAEATKLLNHVTNRSQQITNMVVSFTDVPYTYWAYTEIMCAANYV